MRVVFRTSFLRDARKLKAVRVGERVRAVIESVESASALADVPNLKKLSGASGYYRVRVGDHRKEIYRYFP